VQYRPPPNDRAHRARVCMIVHSHYPVGEPRAEREARAAVEAGYAVDVICLRRPHEPAFETVDGIGVIRLPVQHVRGRTAIQTVAEYGGFAARAALAVLRIRRSAAINVVYVHAPPDFLIIAALLPRLLGSGVVLDVHDLSPHMFQARYGGRPFSAIAGRALGLVERAACALADRIVTVHAPYRDELMVSGVPARKIAVVMNAPAPEAVARAKATLARRRHEHNSFVVAYHGTITRWYGVDILVEAIGSLKTRIPELRAIVLGEGDALPAVEELARRVGVEERIEFSRAYVPHDEALARVAAAGCGVIPNRHSLLNRFALSSKLLEYVTLGIPVVVAHLETLAAHFAPDEVTFFTPDDPASLAAAVAWVAENPDEAQRKSERARLRAEDYSWPVSRDNFLSVLRDAMVARKRAPGVIA
jgi:glycosyltransferase involved in cell wall biosynthesis